VGEMSEVHIGVVRSSQQSGLCPRWSWRRTTVIHGEVYSIHCSSHAWLTRWMAVFMAQMFADSLDTKGYY
jgi:hypothetical protein